MVSWSGTITSTEYTGADCSGSINGVGTSAVFGVTQYDRETGLLLSSGTGQDVLNGTTVATYSLDCPTYDPVSVCDHTVTCDPKLRTFAGNGVCCVVGSANHRMTGTATATLSDEDLPFDAISRGGGIHGTSSSAFLTDFNAGTFCLSGQSSRWTAVISGTSGLCSYRLTVKYSRDPVTPGDPNEEIVDNFDFFGDGTITGDVPIVVGRTTTAIHFIITSIHIV